jgi:gentisate 1,2-dioxygenase
MQADTSRELADLNQWLGERNLFGHWNTPNRQRPEYKPYQWKWAELRECLMAAAEIVPIEDAGRRVITLLNPSLGDGTITTLRTSIQCLMPGEVAEAHRHSAGAIRWILEGAPRAYCVVEGERVPVSTGDLLTTPSMTWHDHYSEASGPAIWLDCLDNRLVGKLGKSFGGPFPGAQQAVERPDGFSARVMNNINVPWLKSEHPTPPFRYSWEDTIDTLNYLRENEIEPDPYDGFHLVFSHPITGGPTLPTFSCELQLLNPRQRTLPHRHNSSTIYQVFRGHGVTVIDDQRFEWTEGDILAVPAWVKHNHENLSDEDVILFSLSDHPTMTALGLYREQLADQ